MEVRHVRSGIVHGLTLANPLLSQRIACYFLGRLGEVPYSLLSVNVSRESASLVVTFVGSAETDAFDSLASTLDKVHGDATSSAMKTVVADIRGLQFASSACLKAFVAWLQHAQELDDAHRYKVLFKSNPRYSWQRRSLSALKAFAAGVVEIEPEAS